MTERMEALERQVRRLRAALVCCFAVVAVGVLTGQGGRGLLEVNELRARRVTVAGDGPAQTLINPDHIAVIFDGARGGGVLLGTGEDVGWISVNTPASEAKLRAEGAASAELRNGDVRRVWRIE